VEWSGEEWSGVEWSGVESSGVESSGVESSGVESSRVQPTRGESRRFEASPADSRVLMIHVTIFVSRGEVTESGGCYFAFGNKIRELYFLSSEPPAVLQCLSL
jgi:hypothetical protein